MRRLVAACCVALLVAACAQSPEGPASSSPPAAGAQQAAATLSPMSQFLAKLKILASPIGCLEGVTFSILDGAAMLTAFFEPGVSIVEPIFSGLAGIGTPYCKNLGTQSAPAAGH